MGRSRRQLVEARSQVAVVRPMKSSAALKLFQRRVTCLPSALTGSKRGSEDDGGVGCFLPATEASMSSTCPGRPPSNSTVRPARSAASVHSRSCHAPARSISRSRGTRMRSTPAPSRGTAAISASMAGSCLPRQLPDRSTSRLSPLRRWLRCIAGQCNRRRARRGRQKNAATGCGHRVAARGTAFAGEAVDLSNYGPGSGFRNHRGTCGRGWPRTAGPPRRPCRARYAGW